MRHLIGADEGHRVLSIIMEHTEGCHQNDAAVQHPQCDFLSHTHIDQLLREALNNKLS